MGKAMMKKLIAAALIFTLCVCLCGCGSKQTSNGYIIRVTDAQGKGIASVRLDICTDTTCTLFTTDENGEVKPVMEPGDYTVHLLKIPEGYSKKAMENEYKLTETEYRLEIKLAK